MANTTTMPKAPKLQLKQPLTIFPRQILGKVLKLPPVQNGVNVTADVMIAAPDGVKLATDIYRANTPDTAPTILIRTPYGKNGILGFFNTFTAQRLAERGYNVAVQDVRGRFKSEGTFIPYQNEASDGRALLDWVNEQSWSNGKFAMWGASYLGYCQYAIASTNPEGLVALAPTMTNSEIGGVPEHALELDLILRWLLMLDAMGNPKLSVSEKAGRIASEGVQSKLVTQAANHLPLSEADNALLGYDAPFFQEWNDHPDPNDPYWTNIGLKEEMADAPPGYFVGGWYDFFIDGILEDYERQVSAGMTPYLTVGPWRHIDSRYQSEQMREMISWYDMHLLGAEPFREKPVRLYIMGSKEWRDFEAFPPISKPLAYYLLDGGWLSQTASTSDTSTSAYTYDPANPTPNIGGALISSTGGRRNQRPLEKRDDVLLFTTPVLPNDIEIIGTIKAELFVESTAPYTDFVVRLCDVYPDGRSYNVCENLYRVTPERGEKITDSIRKISFELSATAFCFKRGHKMRIHVTSGAHPRWGRNLGYSEFSVHQEEEGMISAAITLHHSKTYPSSIILPITI